jgi:hypothetical protein
MPKWFILVVVAFLTAALLTEVADPRASWAPMTFDAPGWFSTMTGWPIASDKRSATIRRASASWRSQYARWSQGGTQLDMLRFHPTLLLQNPLAPLSRRQAASARSAAA